MDKNKVILMISFNLIPIKIIYIRIDDKNRNDK